MKPIWIVDDDQSIRFVLEKALARDHLPTRSFTNPREVLQALDAANDEDGPQILVSDIRMPGGSGLRTENVNPDRRTGIEVEELRPRQAVQHGRRVRLKQKVDRAGVVVPELAPVHAALLGQRFEPQLADHRFTIHNWTLWVWEAFRTNESVDFGIEGLS